MMRHWPLLLSAVAGLSLSCAHERVEQAALEQPAAEPQPIRAFDVPTIEQLGRAMYEQDRLAWIATDVLFAELTEAGAVADGVSGWITSTRDGHDAVRFLRDGEDGPEVLYDVVFAGDGPPTFSTPADRALLPDERAQYEARALALGNAPDTCSERYNTVALRDPESDGWLVWVMAATVEPGVMVIGGHYRFAISPDGRQIRSRDALSTSCLQIETSDESVGSIMNHVVSLTPVETHVFASLAYKRLLHVGTLDGTTWRIAEGRVTRVDQDSTGFDGIAARALAGIDETCTLITSNESDPTWRTKVIEATEQAGGFSVEQAGDERVEMIGCLRRDIVPSPNDYKVVAAGYPLMIADRGAGHPPRKGVLRLEGGALDYRIVDGEPLSEELAKRVDARLDRFRKAIAASP